MNEFQNEKILLEDEIASVTKSVFKYNGTIYPIHGITAIELLDDPDDFPYPALILGISLSGIGVTYRPLSILLFIGLVFLLISFYQISKREKNNSIVIHIASGEHIEISDQEYPDIDDLYDALDEALELRDE